MSGLSFCHSGLPLKQQLYKSISNAENVRVNSGILHSVCFTCLQSSLVLWRFCFISWPGGLLFLQIFCLIFLMPSG